MRKMSEMDELSDFLAIDMRLDVKSVALQQVLSNVTRVWIFQIHFV